MHHSTWLTNSLLGRIMMPMKIELAAIEKYLQEYGLLLVVDNEFPSYVTMITGEPIKGSWWGHPQGNFIYNSLNQFLDRPNILELKFLNRKTTLMEARHWGALVTIGSSEAPWQTLGLSALHLQLFNEVRTQGVLRTDEYRSSLTVSEIGKLASKLEERLLIYSESIHTESGKHARVLYSWDELARERKVMVPDLTADQAQMYFELVLEDISAEKRPRLPWE